MHRAPFWLLATVSLGCNSGKIEIPDEFYEGLTDDGSSGGGGGDLPGGGGSGGGSTPGDPGGDNPGGGGGGPDDGDDWPDDDWGDDDPWGGDQWAEYWGETTMYLVDDRGGYVDFCTGENAWTVDGGGWAGGEGWCEIYRGSRAGEYLYLQYEGEAYRGGEIYGQLYVYRSWSDRWDELEWQAWSYSEGREGYLESWATGWTEGRNGWRQLDAYGYGYQY
jgi:hypothetical protein